MTILVQSDVQYRTFNIRYRPFYPIQLKRRPNYTIVFLTKSTLLRIR